jgi:hypothetical protein
VAGIEAGTLARRDRVSRANKKKFQCSKRVVMGAQFLYGCLDYGITAERKRWKRVEHFTLPTTSTRRQDS